MTQSDLRPGLKFLFGALVSLSIVSFVVGWLFLLLSFLSKATFGVGIAVTALYLAILARIVQAAMRE